MFFHFKLEFFDDIKTFDLFFLTFIFSIPFFPLPKSPLGLLGTVVVLSLSLYMFLLIILKHKNLIFNRVVVFFIFSLITLTVFDLINGIRFDAFIELKYAFARLVSLFVFLLVIFYLYGKGLKGLNNIFLVILISAVIVSVLIILEGFGVVSMGFSSDEGRRLFGVRLPFRKATGVPLSDGKLGTFLIPAFILLIIPNISKNIITESWRWVFLSIIGVGIIIMQSRSGWLGLVAGLSFLTLYYVLKNKYTSYYIFALTTLLMIFYFSPLGSIVLDGFIGQGVQARTVGGRFFGAEQALEASEAAFFFGQGHGVFFIENEVGKVHFIHNLYLDQLVANGIVGFLLLLFTHLFFLWIVVAKLLDSSIKHGVFILLWLVTCWLSIFVELNIYRGFFNEYVYVYMAMAVYMSCFYNKDTDMPV